MRGDGFTGVMTFVIQTGGSTSLTEVGSNFFLYDGGTGPALKYSGAAVVAGQFGGWVPIGAEHTTGGYDVAWKMPDADQFTVWSTDSKGNYISNLTRTVSGGSAVLESLETIFHQDLNGDATIGIPSSPASPTLAFAGASTDTVTFAGSPGILSLDSPSTFNGQIIDFTGDGSLAGSDQIDLRGMDYNTFLARYNNSTGILDVSDAGETADPPLGGGRSQADYNFADLPNPPNSLH